MSLSLGNLKDTPLATLLDDFHRDGRSGVLRIRSSGPQGMSRADIVVRDGMIVGAAIYRDGGVKGMGDKLVDEALCAPDDAFAATERAAMVCDDAAGSLAAGAARVGVSYARVVEALSEHIHSIVKEIAGWTGAAELALEGLPRGGSDRDSAAARAFALDEGIPPSSILPPPVAAEQPASSPGFDPFDAPPDAPPDAPADAPLDALPDASADAFAHPEELTEPEAPIAEGPFADESWQSDPTHEIPAVAAAAEPEPERASAAVPEAEPEPEPESDDFDDSDDEPSVGDLSGPGFGESALMEAETLLDGEVLAVMLEMGTSAAAVAATEVVPETIATGDVLLVDDEGLLLPILVPALRGADLTVHIAKGLADALARVSDIGESGVRPLLICDLLLKRGDAGGMLGGLDVAAACAELVPRLPVLLLCETLAGDLEERAVATGATVLARPLRAELKRDDAARDEFLARLLAVVDGLRPRAAWSVSEGATGENIPGDSQMESSGETGEESGWDVDAIERRSREVEDLPDLTQDGIDRQDSLWREAMHLLSSPMSQPEILLQILRFAAEVLGRSVLFTPSGASGDLVGFGQFGVELAPGVNPDEAVRQIRIPPDGHPLVQDAVAERAPRRGEPGDSTWETYLVRALGGVAPREIFVGPVFCQGKLAALLYGDSLGSASAIRDTRNLEVVLGQAGLALDRSVLEARLKALEGGTT